MPRCQPTALMLLSSFLFLTACGHAESPPSKEASPAAPPSAAAQAKPPAGDPIAAMMAKCESYISATDASAILKQPSKYGESEAECDIDAIASGSGTTAVGYKVEDNLGTWTFYSKRDKVQPVSGVVAPLGN